MPTHWESSKRPLFVRTVLVNGSRHAILTQEDPLLQTTQVHKCSRPGSAHSDDSNTSCQNTGTDAQPKIEPHEEVYKGKGGRKSPRDLQACIVKLRLVLAEKRKAATIGQVSQPVDTGNKKRKRAVKCNNRKKACGWHEQPPANDHRVCAEPTEECSRKPEYDTNHNITVASFFSSESNIAYQCQSSVEEDVDCIKGHCHPQIQPEITQETSKSSTLNINPEYDVPWNTISAESYFTRPFYNRLSERVLQWLDLASKRKNNPATAGNEKKSEMVTKPKPPLTARSESHKAKLSHRDNSEDNSDEVKSEEDVDTVLSREFPRFSQELNRLHYLKSEIPAKQQPYASQLQESIAQSFTSIVSIRSGKYAQKPKPLIPVKPAERRGKLVRQTNLEESSEEDGNEGERKTEEPRRRGFFNRNSIISRTFDNKIILSKQDIPDPHPLSHLTPQLQSRIPWLRDCNRGTFWPSEKAIGKPQLHIFIPASANENEECSEVDSLASDGE